MSDTNNSPLDDLFVKEEALSNELLRDTLVNYVKLTPEGKIFPLPGFNELKNSQKILAILLAKKVLKLKLNLDESTSPTEIQEITGLSKGTVNPTLTHLAHGKFLINVGGKYSIPNYAILNVSGVFKNG